MARTVRGGLIQVKCDVSLEGTTADVKQRMIDKTMPLVEDAGKRGVQALCPQELFYGPYFCAEQKTKWYELTEEIPHGPTTTLFQDVAKRYGMVVVVPIYEVENTGVYYNTAAIIDAGGAYLGKYRKHHIPQVARRVPGRAFTTSVPATPATPCSRRPSARSASTSVTTAISQRARASWD